MAEAVAQATVSADLATKRDLGEMELRLTNRIDRIVARLGALVVIVAGLLFTALHYIPPAHGAEPSTRPYSCRLLDDAERACAFGACDQRERERLRKECLRDGGRP
jgi:hypothetical protein